MSLVFPESYGELEVLAHHGATADELARRLAERERLTELERFQLDVQARSHVGATIDDHRARWGRVAPTRSEPSNSAGPPPADDVPAGTMADVLAWVGDDKERARAAVKAEKARPDPRTSLLAKLAKIADA